MNEIPISTIFIGINGLIALTLSYIVAMERTRTRVWHGESQEDVAMQPRYLKPNAWAAFFENLTQKSAGGSSGADRLGTSSESQAAPLWGSRFEQAQKLVVTTSDDGMLQRKVRAHGNFTEYVPLGLLFLVALELMQQNWLVWLLGSTLTLGRIAHAYGLIKTYGPSPGRASGFFMTWFVYGVGAGACIYFGLIGAI